MKGIIFSILWIRLGSQLIYLWQINNRIFDLLLKAYTIRKWWEKWIPLLFLPIFWFILLPVRRLFMVWRCRILAFFNYGHNWPLPWEWSQNRIKTAWWTWSWSPLHGLVRSSCYLHQFRQGGKKRFSRKTTYSFTIPWSKTTPNLLLHDHNNPS